MDGYSAVVVGVVLVMGVLVVVVVVMALVMVGVEGLLAGVWMGISCALGYVCVDAGACVHLCVSRSQIANKTKTLINKGRMRTAWRRTALHMKTPTL